MKHRPLRNTRGFSLLEAIVAVGIFVASMAMIGQLLDVGVRFADRSKLQTQALLRAESMMEEIVAGIRSVSSESLRQEEKDPADPRWRARVSREETTVSGLLRITVVVERFEEIEGGEEDEPIVTESLTRLVADRTPPAVEPTRPGETMTVTLPTLMGLSGGGASR